MLKNLLIKVLIFSLFFSMSLSMICGSNFDLHNDYTICNKDNGYGCCQGLNAVCCEDRRSCCPSFSTCDLREKKCIPKNSLNKGFLLSEPKFLEMTEMTNYTVNITFNDTTQMIDGFLFALNFSGFVKSYDSCKVETFNLGSNFIDLIYSIKEFNQFNNTSKAISTIIRDIGEVFHDVFLSYEKCREIPSELSGLFAVLIKYFSNENYFRSFYNNLMKNMFFYMSMWAKVKSDFELGKYFQTGKDFGELFFLVVFPEIEELTKSVNFEFYNYLKSQEDKNKFDLKRIIKCFVNNSSENISLIKAMIEQKDLEEIYFLFTSSRSLLKSCLAEN